MFVTTSDKLNFQSVVDNYTMVKKDYQWAVSNTKFPNLDEVEFYSFSLLTNEEFATHKKDIDLFKKELTTLGLTNDEIRILFCSDYKICY